MHPTIHPDNRSGTTGSAGADLEQEDRPPLMAPANSLNLGTDFWHHWVAHILQSLVLQAMLVQMFLGSMLPQYMALSVSFVSQFVKKKLGHF